MKTILTYKVACFKYNYTHKLSEYTDFKITFMYTIVTPLHMRKVKSGKKDTNFKILTNKIFDSYRLSPSSCSSMQNKI